MPFAEDSFTYDAEAFGSRSVRLQMLLEAYGIYFDRHELLRAMSDRLDVLASYSDVKSQIFGRSKLAEHALMHRKGEQKGCTEDPRAGRFKSLD